jgi:hypothetical protein
VLLPPPALMVSLPPLPNTRSAPLPVRILSAPSEELSPPPTVCAALAAEASTVSAPSLPNSCSDPVPAGPRMLSFSVPPRTDPVLPPCSRTLSLPELPNAWTLPLPVEI